MSWRLIHPDPPEGGELPATEFVHPLPLGALLVLAVNDHLFKGSGWLPGVITGKISDFAGLFFFPLLLTACSDVLIYGINVILRRHRLDASLRMAKLIAAGVFTAALFTSIKLSAGAARFYLQLLERLDVTGLLSSARVVQDPTDLAALPMIVLAVWFGRRHLAEIPPARLAFVMDRIRRGAAAEPTLRAELGDCRRAARRPVPTFEALVHGLAPYLSARATGQGSGPQRDRAIRALSGWRT
ncbi:MAG: hypothetical protein ABIJ09_11135 [Pseudomonadota bacterium]